MEAKKNPQQDVHRQSGKFFLIGLSISVALVITAFEWRSVTTNDPKREYDPISNEAVFQVQAHVIPEKITAPKKKVALPQVIPVLTPDSEPESLTEPDKNPQVETDPYAPIGIDSSAFVPEPPEPVFIAPEFRPLPEGGYEAFYKFVSKNLKYPRRARQSYVQGKVFVEFVVDKNGKVTDMKVIKGIGSGCDEEAMRVLALTKWQPGRQRGNPVKVKMTMPLNFVLN
ncbi:MAG: TonB family protein [Cyclobacteriaceae bacterium]|nr:TonB family protein [Cyclobacteriaceae bacterium]